MTPPVKFLKLSDSFAFDWADFPAWTDMAAPVPLLLDPGFDHIVPAGGPAVAYTDVKTAHAPAEHEEDVIELDMTETIDDHGMSALRSAVIGSDGDIGGAAGTRLMTTYTSGAVGKYNVTVNFQGVSSLSTGGWTSSIQNAFVGAAERISKMIVGDLPSVMLNGRKIDDIQITASMKAIDGVGGVLGQAGMTAVRATSMLPSSGAMIFDTADAQRYLGMGLFDEIVTHEMLHCVGYGTLWTAKGLVTGTNFIGQKTVEAFNALVDEYAASHEGSLTLPNGAVLFKDLVPLETTGGAGTAGSHWSEKVFNTEMMTGYLDLAAANGTAVAPLSAMTMASLQDLGYMTGDLGATDSFRLV